jgi:uncharacterized protein
VPSLVDEPPRFERITALDLIRGVAILGILAVNIEGFGAPMAGAISPNWNGAASTSDHIAYLITMVLFEGKMRALLSILFGASLVLFIGNAEVAGRNGDTAQMRRLFWLAAIGYLHFLFWWGDILFTYALAGFAALIARHLPNKAMVPAALLIFTAWHAGGMAGSVQPMLAEISLNQAQHELRSNLTAEEAEIKMQRDRARADGLAEMQREAGSLPALIQHKIIKEASFPFTVAMMTLGETLPLMLIGIALFRSGFFTGGWSQRRLMQMAIAGCLVGGLATLGLAWFVAKQDFTLGILQAVLGWWAALPHLAMGLGYAAALVLIAQRGTKGRLASRVSSIGKMALSNYLGCTLIMTGLFYGWGFGLIGKIPERWYLPITLICWIVMLLVSKSWLERYRQGPVEWLWRSLTQWHILPFRR